MNGKLKSQKPGKPWRGASALMRGIFPKRKSSLRLAAVSAYTHYKVVKKFYRKIKRRSGRSVARAVVAKELAKGVWFMLTRNEEYKDLRDSL